MPASLHLRERGGAAHALALAETRGQFPASLRLLREPPAHFARVQPRRATLHGTEREVLLRRGARVRLAHAAHGVIEPARRAGGPPRRRDARGVHAAGLPGLTRLRQGRVLVTRPSSLVSVGHRERVGAAGRSLPIRLRPRFRLRRSGEDLGVAVDARREGALGEFARLFFLARRARWRLV